MSPSSASGTSPRFFISEESRPEHSESSQLTTSSIPAVQETNSNSLSESDSLTVKPVDQDLEQDKGNHLATFTNGKKHDNGGTPSSQRVGNRANTAPSNIKKPSITHKSSSATNSAADLLNSTSPVHSRSMSLSHANLSPNPSLGFDRRTSTPVLRQSQQNAPLSPSSTCDSLSPKPEDTIQPSPVTSHETKHQVSGESDSTSQYQGKYNIMSKSR